MKFLLNCAHNICKSSESSWNCSLILSSLVTWVESPSSLFLSFLLLSFLLRLISNKIYHYAEEHFILHEPGKQVLKWKLSHPTWSRLWSQGHTRPHPDTSQPPTTFLGSKVGSTHHTSMEGGDRETLSAVDEQTMEVGDMMNTLSTVDDTNQNNFVSAFLYF